VRLALLGGLTFTSGCGTTQVADNPVVGPRPPRVSDRMLAQWDEQSADPAIASTAASDVASDVASDDSRLVTASGASNGASGVRAAILETAASVDVLQDSDVAARVNGTPIFVSEVLERYRGQLEAQRLQMAASDYQTLRRQLVEKELPGHIEQGLVLDAARKQFKQDQWDSLQDKLDEFFYEEELPDLQKRLQASSLPEVEARLKSAGTSLSAYRRVWGNHQIAGQWVSERLPEVSVSRQELLHEYESQRENYREPEQVKWQECLILIENGDAARARQRLDAAISDLKSGVSFDEVVARHSDGVRAADGGHWDWTQPTSLADDRLREVLTTIQLEQISPVLEDDRGFRLVKLTGYRPERVTPFEEVQKELREAVAQRKRAEAAEQVIEKLRKEAHIETIFDPSRRTG
jgi:parvulin-like peptidyl-prolyl isomerase